MSNKQSDKKDKKKKGGTLKERLVKKGLVLK